MHEPGEWFTTLTPYIVMSEYVLGPIELCGVLLTLISTAPAVRDFLRTDCVFFGAEKLENAWAWGTRSIQQPLWASLRKLQ